MVAVGFNPYASADRTPPNPFVAERRLTNSTVAPRRNHPESKPRPWVETHGDHQSAAADSATKHLPQNMTPEIEPADSAVEPHQAAVEQTHPAGKFRQAAGQFAHPAVRSGQPAAESSQTAAANGQPAAKFHHPVAEEAHPAVEEAHPAAKF